MKKFKNVISIIVLLAIFAQNVTGNFEIIFADSETINETDNDILEEPALEVDEAANEKTADEILNDNKSEEPANEIISDDKQEEPENEILNGDKQEKTEESKEPTETKNDLDKTNSDNSEDIVSESSSIENNKNSENSAEENTEESTEVTSETEQLLPFEEIEKFEVNLSDVPDEISALADRNYKKLNQSEQAALKAYYHVRKDTMDECAAKGFSVKDSIPLALIMQRLDIDLNEAINMSVSYQSEKKALKESFDFAELKDDNLELLNNEKVKEEIVDAIVDGCGSEEVVEAYPIAYAFNRDLKDFVDENINKNDNTSDSSKEISDENKISAANNISNENDTSSEKNNEVKEEINVLNTLNEVAGTIEKIYSSEDSENLSNDTKKENKESDESQSQNENLSEKNKPENKAVNEKVKAISEKYQLDANLLDTAVNEENITPEEAEEKINQAEEELGISLASSSADDNESLPQKAPCDYVPGMFENVDILSGTVSYHDDIINLEGLNGLDLNLFYEYNSRRKMYMTVINGYDAIEMGGWTLNIPRMTSGCFYDIGKVPSLDKDDKSPGYIMLDDGREFKASMESIYSEKGDTGYLYLDDYAYSDVKWAQEAKVVYDKDHAGGRNSKYTVLYQDGKKDYFNERGLLLFREDFLGNQITFDYNNSGSLIIKDTLNREVKVTFTDGSYSEIKQIILPDGKVISYTNSNPNISSGNYRITKTESKNGKSLTTFFDMNKTSGCIESHYEQIKGTEVNNSNKDERFNYDLKEEVYSSSLLVKVTMPTNMYITYEYKNDEYFNKQERQKDDDETLYDYKVAPYGLGCSERISKISYYKDSKNYYWEMYDTLDYSGSQSKRRFFRRVKTSRTPNAYTEIDFNPQGQKTAEYFVYTDSDNTKTIEVKEYTYPTPRQVYREKPYYFLYNERYALKLAGYEDIYSDVPEKVTTQKGTAVANVDDNMRAEFKIDRNKPIYYHEDNYNYQSETKLLISSKSYPEETEYSANPSYISSSTKRFTRYGKPNAETFKKSDNSKIVVKNYYSSDEKYLTSKETYEEKGTALIFKSKTDYSYNTDGRISKKVDYVDKNTKGLRTTYTYSGTTSPTLVKTELPNGEYIETKYTYDIMGNVTSMTDGEGRKTQYEYDWRGNLSKVTNPQGSAKSSVFDYAANKITLTDENGNTVTYDYDCFGNLEEVKAGNSLLKKCEYDYKNFCLIKETSPDNKTVTSYTYDSACRPVSKITLENGKEIYNETMSYGMENVSQYTKNLPSGKNATGNVVTSVVKGDGVNTQSITTKTVTDYNGNTISQECGGVKKSYEYDAMGNMVKESPYAGYSITYEYDPAGNVVSQTDSTGATSKKEYDGLGRLVKEYTPKGIAGNYFTQYTYKGFTDMLKSVTIPLDSGQNMVKEYETDKKGNVLKETVVGGNAGNSVIEYTYNEIGLPVTVTAQGNKEANVTTYTYDKVGNKTSMTTGNALSKTIYKYDNLNRLTYLITVPNETKYTPDAAITVFPEHCIEKYEYDVNGNLSKKTDRNGNVITYAYDGLNRLKSQKTGDLEKTAEYALTGAKVKENYGNAELNYKYDARGNLIYEKSSLDGKSFINEYTYDEKNFLNSFKYKNDNTQVAENTYTYTAKGQLEKVYENGKQVAAYSYDLNGNLEKTTYGNNIETAYGYNYAGLVKSVQSKNGTTVLDSHSYTYYDDGNQKTKTDNGVITTYGYDLYGRLISETAGKEKKNYTYDLSGNRTRLSVSGNKNYNTYYNYDAYNRLTKETTNEKGKAERTDNNYYYDFNGNQTLVTYNNVGDYNSSSADKPFKISARLKLAGNSEERSYNGFNELTHISGNNNVSLTYRPDGLMFKNNNNYYAWQGDNIIYEFGTYYTRGLGLIKASTGLYYLQNGHGDISALAKENGTVSTKYMYDAFGNSSYTGEYSDNLFKYCGEYEDPSLGGIYLRARIYNPETGRFYTEDPARDGMNWYVYCDNNPIKFVDPTGKSKKGDEKLSKSKQKILNGSNLDGKGGLSKAWTLAKNIYKNFIENVADAIRKFDSTHINRIAILNQGDVAPLSAGHTAVMIINESGQAISFSYSHAGSKGFDPVPGQTRISAYMNENEWKNIIYHDHLATNYVANDGNVELEYYTQDALCLTIDNKQGRDVFDLIADMYINPGMYEGLSNNCDTHTAELVRKAGKFYDYHKFSPNESFNSTSLYYKNHKLWLFNKSRPNNIY